LSIKDSILGLLTMIGYGTGHTVPAYKCQDTQQIHKLIRTGSHKIH